MAPEAKIPLRTITHGFTLLDEVKAAAAWTAFNLFVVASGQLKGHFTHELLKLLNGRFALRARQRPKFAFHCCNIEARHGTPPLTVAIDFNAPFP